MSAQKHLRSERQFGEEPTDDHEELSTLKKKHNVNTAMYKKIGGEAFMERIVVRMEALSVVSALILSILYPYIVEAPSINNKIISNVFVLLTMICSILCMISIAICLQMIIIFTTNISTNRHFVLFLTKYWLYMRLPEQLFFIIASCWLTSVILLCFDKYPLYIGWTGLILIVISLSLFLSFQVKFTPMLNNWAIETLISQKESTETELEKKD